MFRRIDQPLRELSRSGQHDIQDGVEKLRFRQAQLQGAVPLRLPVHRVELPGESVHHRVVNGNVLLRYVLVPDIGLKVAVKAQDVLVVASSPLRSQSEMCRELKNACTFQYRRKKPPVITRTN